MIRFHKMFRATSNGHRPRGSHRGLPYDARVEIKLKYPIRQAIFVEFGGVENGLR
jgi:hypothetical protein